MECCLAFGELIRVGGEKEGVVLHCTGGVIWLTCGDGRDYLLTAGKSFEIAARQVAVAEALSAAECTIGKPVTLRQSVKNHAMRLAVC